MFREMLAFGVLQRWINAAEEIHWRSSRGFIDSIHVLTWIPLHTAAQHLSLADMILTCEVLVRFEVLGDIATGVS